VSLRIWHTSDLHDRRQAVARVAALRDAEPGLLFDCGDSLRGSQTVYHRDEPIIAQIDAARYDAQGMGNREFHYLFGAVRARAAKMRHPLVCSNLVDVRGRPLPFAADATFELRDGTRAWRVRVFSLLVVQYPHGSPWERVFGWRFLDPIGVARGIAAETPGDTVLVALSHLGLRADRTLASAAPRIDLILGGHSHDTLFEPEVVDGVPIVHAGPYGAYASRTELEAGAYGRPRVVRSHLVPVLARAA